MSSKIWGWRRMEKIKWSEKVTKEQVIGRIEEKRILRRKDNWVCLILRRIFPDAIEG